MSGRRPTWRLGQAARPIPVPGGSPLLFAGSLSVEVAPRSNLLLAVHADLGRPQFLSTDRHLTQGAVSLRTLRWEESRLILSGSTDLVAGEQTHLIFAVPPAFQLEAVEATQAKVGLVTAGGDETVTVAIRSSRAVTAAWQLRFTRSKGPCS